MFLGSLRVIHLSKSGVAVKPPAAFCTRFEGAFHVDSCQRWIWVESIDPESSSASENSDLLELTKCGAKVYVGADAYQFLLQVATGLESQVIGETDIFGQLKEAWKVYAKSDAPFVPDLASWMQKLFEDTKEIRTQYMQNLGGSSYGSLLRKLMREKNSVTGTTLLIGAGALAESVAPYLDNDLLISNRNPERAEALAALLRKQNPDARVQVLGSASSAENELAELEAMKSVARVVLAIPVKVPPNGMDSQRIAYLKTRPDIHVIHLGARTGESKDWDALPSFDSLDSLFEIEKSMSRTRSVQVERARSACRERSKLRGLGAGSFVAHGWEDLAVFA